MLNQFCFYFSDFSKFSLVLCVCVCVWFLFLYICFCISCFVFSISFYDASHLLKGAIEVCNGLMVHNKQ
jgi:hypothetical protein